MGEKHVLDINGNLYKMGLDFVGCELDKDYFEAQEERFKRECMGEYKRKDGSIVKQLTLF